MKQKILLVLCFAAVLCSAWLVASSPSEKPETIEGTLETYKLAAIVGWVARDTGISKDDTMKIIEESFNNAKRH